METDQAVVIDTTDKQHHGCQISTTDVVATSPNA